MTAPANANSTAPVTAPEGQVSLEGALVAEGMAAIATVHRVGLVAAKAREFYESRAAESN